MIKTKQWIQCLSLALIASTAVAQQRDVETQNRDRTQSQQPQSRTTNDSTRTDERNATSQTANRNQAGNNQLDSHIANCLILGNQEEIAILKWSSDKTNNEELKKTAKKMIEDHEQFVQKLAKFASHQPQEVASWLDETQSEKVGFRGTEEQNRQTQNAQQPQDRQVRPRENDREEQRPGTQRNDAVTDANAATQREGVRTNSTTTHTSSSDSNSVLMQVYQLDKEATKECLKMTKQALEEKQGEEFDKALLGQQMSAHIGMIAKLKASGEAATGELQTIIKEGEKTAKEHKEHVHQLKEQLMGESSPTSPGTKRSNDR